MTSVTCVRLSAHVQNETVRVKYLAYFRFKLKMYDCRGQIVFHLFNQVSLKVKPAGILNKGF